jgi:hypothetical protein
MDRLIELKQGKDRREKPGQWFPAHGKTDRTQGEARSADESTHTPDLKNLALKVSDRPQST